MSAASWRRSSFPVAVCGSSPTKTTVSGVLDDRSLALVNSRTSSADSSASCPSTMNAPISWPHSSLGRPVTATSATPGICSMTASISAGAMFSPPRMIVSSERPRTNR